MPSTHSLLPREHGAYAEVGFPIVTGLLMGRPSVVGYCLASATILAFFAHEPIAVLLGTRGDRMRVLYRVAALRRAVALCAAVVIVGLMAIALASPATRLAALPAALLAAVLIGLALAKRLKTLVGELLMAVTFAAMLTPVALAGTVAWPTATGGAIVWALTFILATFTVHAVKARTKATAPNQWTKWFAPACSGVVLVAAVWLLFAEVVPTTVALALFPGAVVTLAVNALRIDATKLRAIGWTLVAANVVTAVVIV